MDEVTHTQYVCIVVNNMYRAALSVSSLHFVKPLNTIATNSFNSEVEYQTLTSISVRRRHFLWYGTQPLLLILLHLDAVIMI